jgi:hypothetical protein
LIKGEDVVKYTKARSMNGGDLSRREDIKLVTEITDGSTVGVRTTERPKNRWRDEVINELK